MVEDHICILKSKNEENNKYNIHKISYSTEDEENGIGK